jgi:hypothetical protein
MMPGMLESEYSKKVSKHFKTENIEFKCGIEPEDIKDLIYYLKNPWTGNKSSTVR